MQLIENSFRHDTCPLCKGYSISKVGIIQYDPVLYYSTVQIKLSLDPELWKCKDCESSFVQNTILESTSVELYQQGTSDKRWVSKTFQESKTDEVIACMETLLKPHKRVLDIGCAGGAFLDFAKERDCVTCGVEYSLDNLKTLDEKGHTPYGGMEFTEGLFDLVTAFDVVEHLYQPVDFLERCLSKLAPGGYLAFLTGDISCFSAKICSEDWWYTRFPEHIVFPSIQYFKNHSKVNVTDCVRTYAGRSYVSSAPIAILRNMKSVLLSASLSACQSSIGGDHYLIILQHK